ncbi:hypothetical protein [Streptomyces sp. NPDC059455]|uniref:hypothetical protein n=1 Tax=Streptomyces sp. NPDC059455 TaxID=3346837 RepID=UPI0036B0C79D
MTGEGEHPTDDGAPDELRARAVAAVREARELLSGNADGMLESAALLRVIDRLTAVEELLPPDCPDRAFVVPQLGALLGLR